MDFDLATIAIVFGAIFLVELPDKTFIATLVLSTRFRPLFVWIGVCLAFLVQTLVAVTVGGLLAQLPKRPVEAFAAVMFLSAGSSSSAVRARPTRRRPRPRRSSPTRERRPRSGSGRSASRSGCSSWPSGATSPSC